MTDKERSDKALEGFIEDTTKYCLRHCDDKVFPDIQIKIGAHFLKIPNNADVFDKLTQCLRSIKEDVI